LDFALREKKKEQKIEISKKGNYFEDFLFDLSFIDPSRLGFNGGVGR